VQLQCVVELPYRSPEPSRERRWNRFLRSASPKLSSEGSTPSEFVDGLPGIAHLRVTLGDDEVLVDLNRQVKSLGLDFLLLFSARGYRAQFQDCASRGVWCFYHTDPQRFQSDVPTFWELYYDHDVGGAALVQLRKGDDAGVFLKSGYFAINRTSFVENVEAKLSAMSNWPAQVCRELQVNPESYVQQPETGLAFNHYGYPSRFQLLRFRWLLAKNSLLKFLRRQLYRIRWNIGVLKTRPATLLSQERTVWPTPLISPRQDEYFADPCAITEDNATFIFLEQYSYRSNRGSIAMIERREGGVSAPITVIAEPFHLSYPQVFKYGDGIYCIPESTSERSVLLYKAVRFPDRWERVHTILQDFAAVDSTLVWWSGNWWLFCTNSDEGYNSHLHIWYSPELFGPWKPHVKNPVKIDARSSGPAGPLILHDDILYRPAQDCSRSYGRRIVMNKVEILTPNDFKESAVGTISPSRASAYHDGLHTISAAGANVIVDMMRYEFQPQGLIGLFTGTAGYFARRLGASEDTIAKLKGKPSRR